MDSLTVEQLDSLKKGDSFFQGSLSPQFDTKLKWVVTEIIPKVKQHRFTVSFEGVYVMTAKATKKGDKITWKQTS